jgi:hypothetical protein
MVAQQGAQLLSNTLRIVEMKTTGEEFDLMPTTVSRFEATFAHFWVNFWTTFGPLATH